VSIWGFAVTNEEVLARITNIIRENLDNDEIILTAETEASDVDGWDSLAHVRIMVAIEEDLNVRFTTDEITSLKDVGSLIALVQARV